MSQSVSIVPTAQQVGNGNLDPSFWANASFMAQVPVLEALPQPPRNEAENAWQMENDENWTPNGEDFPNRPVEPPAEAGA